MLILILLIFSYEILNVKSACTITTTPKINNAAPKNDFIIDLQITSTTIIWTSNCPNGEISLVISPFNTTCYPCINGVCNHGLCDRCRCPSGYVWDVDNQQCSECDLVCQDGYQFGLNCLCQKPCKTGEIYSWLNRGCYSCVGGWCDKYAFCHQCTCPVGEYYDPQYLACLPCRWEFGNSCTNYGLNCECSDVPLYTTTTFYWY